MEGLYHGMNFLAGMVSLVGAVALVFALIGIFSKPWGLGFLFSVIVLSFYILLALKPLMIDLSTWSHVRTELATRPISKMEELTSLYIPRADYEDLSRVCPLNLSRGCLSRNLLAFAALGGDVLLETGTNPIYRWEYVAGSPRCFDEQLTVVFAEDHPQHVARGVCFVLTQVENSTAELRLESGPEASPRSFTLINQETNDVVDYVFSYSPWSVGYPVPLGNRMRQVSSRFGIAFEDYSNGAIFDMLELIENLKIPGFMVDREFREPNTIVPGLVGWQNDLVEIGLRSPDWRIYSAVHKASCRMWNETSPEIRRELLEMAASHDQLLQNCGTNGCFVLNEQSIWQRIECER